MTGKELIDALIILPEEFLALPVTFDDEMVPIVVGHVAVEEKDGHRRILLED